MSQREGIGDSDEYPQPNNERVDTNENEFLDYEKEPIDDVGEFLDYDGNQETDDVSDDQYETKDFNPDLPNISDEEIVNTIKEERQQRSKRINEKFQKLIKASTITKKQAEDLIARSRKRTPAKRTASGSTRKPNNKPKVKNKSGGSDPNKPKNRNENKSSSKKSKNKPKVKNKSGGSDPNKPKNRNETGTPSRESREERPKLNKQSLLIRDAIVDIIEDLELAKQQSPGKRPDQYQFKSEEMSDEIVKREARAIINNLRQQISEIEAVNDVNPRGLEVEYYDGKHQNQLKNILYRVVGSLGQELEINVDFRENGTKEAYFLQLDYNSEHISKQIDVGYHDNDETVSSRSIACLQSEIERTNYVEFRENGTKKLNYLGRQDFSLNRDTSDEIRYQSDGQTPERREVYSYKDGVEKATIFEFYEDGKTVRIREAYHLEDDVETKTTSKFRQDGSKEYETVIKDGLKQSHSKFYEDGRIESYVEFYEDGQTYKKQEVYSYKDGVETKITSEFRRDGTKEFETVVKDGRMESYVEFYEDGKTIKKQEFYSYKDGVETKITSGFRKDGTIEFETVVKNGRMKSYIEFYEDGKTIKKQEVYSYKDGVETNIISEFRRDGTKKFETVVKGGLKQSHSKFYEDGRMESYVEFYEDGQTYKKQEVYSYKDGVETKITSEFRRDGTKEFETVVKDGRIESYVEFYENGQTYKKQEIYSYKGGVETVTTSKFRRNGTKEYETVRKNGKKQTHLELHKDGQTAKRYITYSYDYGAEELTIIEYREDGSKKSDASFFNGEEMSAVFYRRNGETKLLERFCDYKEGVKQSNLVRFKKTSEIKTGKIRLIISLVGKIIGLSQRPKEGVDTKEIKKREIIRKILGLSKKPKVEVDTKEIIDEMLGLSKKPKVEEDTKAIKDVSAIFVNLQPEDTEFLEKVFTNSNQYPTKELHELFRNKLQSKFSSLTLYRKDEELPLKKYAYSDQGGINTKVKTKFRKRGTRKSEKISVGDKKRSIYYRPNGIDMGRRSRLRAWVRNKRVWVSNKFNRWFGN